MPAVDKTPLMTRIIAIINDPVTALRGNVLRDIIRDFLDSVPFRGSSNASDPAGTIYQADGSGVVTPSSLVENTNQIDSTKRAVLPDTSLGLGNWRVLSQGQIIGLQNVGDSDRMFYPIASELGASGAIRPRWFRYGAEATFPSVPDTSENSGAVSSLQFIFLSTATVRATQFRLNSSGAASNVNVQVRLTSHATEPPIFDYARANGGTSFDLVDGENLVTLPIPLFIVANTSLYFTISTPSGTFTLLGETITAMGPSQFVPFTDVIGRAAPEIDDIISSSSSVTDLSDVTSAGSGAIITTAERAKLAGLVSALNTTNIPVDVQVTSGVWGRTTFAGVHFLLDSSQVTGDITEIQATSGTTFGNDIFFAISNLDSEARDFTLHPTLAEFSGVGTSRTLSLPGNSCTLFFVDVGSPAPIARFSLGGTSDDHPIIVARDTPSLTVLAEVAAASVNGNTGFWLVANDQIAGNEAGVDGSIQIRALVDGLLDLNGDVIPTSNVAKSGIVLAAGTQVRVFSNTSLRVVSTPFRSPTARYPDIFVLTDISLTSSGLYNTYRNRTSVSTAGSGITRRFTLADLSGTDSAAFLNRDDVFCFRNDGDGIFAITVGQAADSFSNGETSINLQSGEYLCVSPAPTGSVYTILEQGQFTELRDTVQPIMLNDWYRDEVDALAADDSVRLHRRRTVQDGNVRDHVKASSNTTSQATLRFQRRNEQDDIAWFEWWATFEPLTPLGATIQEIDNNLPIGLTTIETNINSGYDFAFNDPGVNFVASSITFISGNTYRVVVPSALPSYLLVGDVIRHTAFANAQNNGSFAITAIAGDRLSYDIEISPNNGATSNETPGGLVTRSIFADITAISHGLRSVTFNLYADVGRTALLSAVPSKWFDIDTDPVPAENVLNIGYNTDVAVLGSTLAVEDDAGDFFQVKGGPRRSTFYFDNVTPNYANNRELPLSFEDIVINTDGIANLFLPVFPDELQAGEVRRYRIQAHPDVNQNDIDFQVGRSGDTVTFDEGFSVLTILAGKYQDIEVYNDGLRSGVRLASPLQRSMSSVLTLTTPVTANTIARIPISIIDIPNSQNEDIDYRFMRPTINDELELLADGDYTLEGSVVVQFSGTEPVSAFLFANVQLLPVVTRNSVATNLTQFQDVASIQMERGGLTNGPKPQYTLRCQFDWQGRVGDLVQFQPIFLNIPSGFTASDFEYTNSAWRSSVNLRLD